MLIGREVGTLGKYPISFWRNLSKSSSLSSPLFHKHVNHLRHKQDEIFNRDI